MTAMTRGSDGLLWLGTEDGLFRFDGISFKRYTPLPGNALLSEHVINVIAAPDGSLWVSYLFGGMSRINGGKVTNYTEREGLGSGQISSLAIDRGVVWLAGTDGVYRVVGSKVDHVDSKGGIPSGSAYGLVLDPSDNLWIPVRGKVMVLPAGQFQFQVATVLSDGKTPACWSTLPDGVRCRDDSGWHAHLRYGNGRVVQTESLDLPSPYNYLSATDGSLWATTYGHGVQRISAAALRTAGPGASVETFDSRNGLASDFAFDVMEDREGSIWVSTDRGLDQFRPKTFHTAAIPPANATTLAKSGRNSQVYFASDRLFSVVDGRITQLTDRLTTDGIRALYSADDGTVWIGVGETLLHFADGKLSKQAMPQDLNGSRKDIQSISEDAQHCIWVYVIRNGLFRLHDGVWVRKGGHAELPDQPQHASMRDHLGNLWFGYLDGGVANISATGQVRVWAPPKGPQIGAVKVFAELGNAVLIGGDEGVVILRDGQFYRLELVDASNLRGVTGLVIASDGDLWINGSMGIVRVPKVELSETLAHPGYKSNFEMFDYHDGVRNTPSPVAGLGSALQGLDGNLYFATRTDLNWIDPRTIRRNAIPPVATVDEVTSDGQTILWPSPTFELRPNPQTIQIRYEGGSLLIPDRVRFRYRLENYDNDWTDAGGRREAYYSKLPPGRYTFQVAAANDAGVWSNRAASVTFTVLPTFVQTIWFKLGVLLGLIALFFLISRIRLNLTKRRIANHMYEILGERQRIARDLHDTLLQSVQALMFKVAVATKKLPPDSAVRPILEATVTQSDQVLLEGRKLIMKLQTKEEPSDALLDTLREVGEELRNTYPSTQFVVDARGSERILSTVVNPELGTIGREALANAFRHADAAHVWLTLDATPEELRLDVRDDGRGIDKEVLTQGYRPGHWGLRNMKERARRLGGHCEITSSPETGTTIEIAIPAFVAYKDAPHGVRERIRKLLG
ncbi:signal transduction histidine kinase/ligand-binding sensor domain-containing protein [Granulicella arctica]|uniref:Signal transduction histidine kinase/ligand-binding sensor domain-containing protein n=2 Tax=Granulicella arctica TaxID=940613 RepID=A0A7Y9TSI6_9BACT|nr:signal transduction histidine kinase/ligand-binding sensor domain-containing protein [Granulicella arctica]